MISLTEARALAAAARENTAAGLEAREQLADVVEQLADAMESARGARLIHSSVRKLIDEKTHAPKRVHAYLTANGWERIGEYSTSSDWRHMGDGPDWAVRVLDSADFVDYGQHLASTVETLAEHRGVGELQVLADIAEAGDA